MPPPVRHHRTVLLIGKTGNGKSTVANVLVKGHERNEFPFRENETMVSETFDVQVEEVQVDDVLYRIVDTIGLGDTRIDEKETCLKIASACASIGEGGIYQVLFVSKGKLTKEELQVFDIFKRAIFNCEVCHFTTFVRTNVTFFENSEKCAKDRRLLEGIAAKDDLLLSLVQSKIIFVNNPNEGDNENWAEIRERSRSRLIAILERSNSGQTYNPGSCEEILSRITKYFDQTVENTIAELKKNMEERRKAMEKELARMEAVLGDEQAQGEATARQAKRLADDLQQMKETNEKEIRKMKEEIFHWKACTKLYKETYLAYWEIVKKSTAPDLCKKRLVEGKQRWEYLTSGRIATPRRVVTSSMRSGCVLPHQRPVYEQLSV